VTLGNPLVQYIGIAFFVVGQTFVLTSIYALGITGQSSPYSPLLFCVAVNVRCPRRPIGTYLGDYFGILMKERVTGFPFNVMENPMYNGSTMCFIGTAIWYKKPAGLIISAIVFVVYQIALAYEG
jgi:methylene-fatty-acyl-phospholipid synthase